MQDSLQETGGPLLPHKLSSDFRQKVNGGWLFRKVESNSVATWTNTDVKHVLQNKIKNLNEVHSKSFPKIS